MNRPYFRDHIYIAGQCMCGETNVTQPGEWEQHLYQMAYAAMEDDA